MLKDGQFAFGQAYETEILSGPQPDPVTFLAVEHFRQIWLMNLLDEIVDDMTGPNVASNAAVILDYLPDRLWFHDADEEEDLIPLLLRHSNRNDAVREIGARLYTQHGRVEDVVPKLCSDLTALACGVIPGVPLDFIVRAITLSERLRRHVIWENRTILPLARRRLDQADLHDLGAAMSKRRGLVPPQSEQVAA